jgi:ThiF family protein
MSDLLLLVPHSAAQRIRDGGQWGQITYQVSDPDEVGAVIAVSHGNGPILPFSLQPKTHFLSSADSRGGHRWYRVPAELHLFWWQLRKVRGGLKLEGFKSWIGAGWVSPGGGGYLALTVSADVYTSYPEVDIPDIAAWYVTTNGVTPVDLDVQAADQGVQQLAGYWPVADLAGTAILVVGAGSIGGAAAHALATYGVGRLILLDPDRLLGHNLVRHLGDARYVGQRKVDVLKRQLSDLRPDTVVEAFPLNVVSDADHVRALLRRVHLVLCAADGIAPRRVVSHLARRANLDAVLACVLEDGGLGEIIRLRPWLDRGCLMCQRDALVDDGAIDPEPSLDADYGTGTTHRPMTAVGSDLHLVGQLAAKVSVATLLERRGHPDQKLAGEHCVIGLRLRLGLAPPFDVEGCANIRWLPSKPPRPGCPTCEPA